MVKIEVNAGEFVEAARALYAADPGRISSIPFWKLERFLLESQTYRIVDGGHTCLFATKDDRLLFYWADTKERLMLSSQEVQAFSFLVLHEDFYRLVEPVCGRHTATPGYTLFYDFSFENSCSPNPRYYLDVFDFGREEEYADAARLINQTDGTYHLTSGTVRRWTEVSAFDPTLWIWAKERDTGLPAGIGVSNYNAKMQETDLDWFFVLPPHQRTGVGRMMVKETIVRSKSRSRVIRLGGIADRFYLKCGFQRRDKWFVVRRP